MTALTLTATASYSSGIPVERASVNPPLSSLIENPAEVLVVNSVQIKKLTPALGFRHWLPRSLHWHAQMELTGILLETPLCICFHCIACLPQFYALSLTYIARDSP
jgi:hypothetical protein